VTHHWFVAQGHRLHALAFGSSDTNVVCLHGATSHAWTWAQFAAELGPATGCLAIDLRGHGDSQWSAALDYATDSHASDLEIVLDSGGVKAATVVGSSWGGLIGLALAVRRPDLVDRLVMVDIGPASASSPDDVPPRPMEFLSQVELLDFERSRFPRAERAAVEALACTGTRPGPSGRLVWKHDPHFTQRWSFRAEDHWATLALLRQPLLVVKAIDSPVLSEETAARMAGEAADARVEHIPDAGHVVQVDNPRALAGAIRMFRNG
jgi:pimeloyl-ACP methyl ester carboxylesterase